MQLALRRQPGARAHSFVRSFVRSLARLFVRIVSRADCTPSEYTDAFARLSTHCFFRLAENEKVEKRKSCHVAGARRNHGDTTVRGGEGGVRINTRTSLYRKRKATVNLILHYLCELQPSVAYLRSFLKCIIE